MYQCKDCIMVFEDTKSYTETHGLDSPPYETWTGCPSCGGAYREAIQYDECSEYIVGEYIKINSGVFICESCYSVEAPHND